MQPIKFIADQAKSINQFKNIRIKFLKCCANIYFNRQCQKLGIIPKYANIKVPHTSEKKIAGPSEDHNQGQRQSAITGQ
jgi:hypothetical protein